MCIRDSDDGDDCAAAATVAGAATTMVTTVAQPALTSHAEAVIGDAPLDKERAAENSRSYGCKDRRNETNRGLYLSAERSAVDRSSTAGNAIAVPRGHHIDQAHGPVPVRWVQEEKETAVPGRVGGHRLASAVGPGLRPRLQHGCPSCSSPARCPAAPGSRLSLVPPSRPPRGSPNIVCAKATFSDRHSTANPFSEHPAQ